MSIVRTIVALTSVCFAALTAYAFGHGLSNHHTMPFVVSGASLLITAFLVFVQVRLLPDTPEGSGTH